MITTQGFRDVLELGRRTRPNPYGMTGTFVPVIPRNLRLEVPERVEASGAVRTPLDEEAVRAAVRQLIDAGCESLVIHFLHAYANPAHEKRAAEMFMTGGTLDATRAEKIGMINAVVPAEDLLQEASKLAAHLAAGPTGSFGRIKRMLNASYSNDLRAQLDLEAECQLESGRASDFKEGVAAFFEKRQPSFRGE